jgi:lipopolysaccharide export LptBFGC system permease protein LptF
MLFSFCLYFYTEYFIRNTEYAILMLMPPQQYQQPNQNPYEFILSGPPQKPGFGGGSQKKRILIVAAGGAVLLMVFMLVFSLIFSGGKGSTETLLSIARQQSELIRVANEGAQRARGPQAQNLAMTTKLSLTSAQQDLQAYIKSQGIKVKQKELAAPPNSRTDAELTAAEQDNRFDEAFTALMQQQLTAYQAALKQAYDETSSRSGRQVLSDSHAQVELLLGKPQNQSAAISP